MLTIDELTHMREETKVVPQLYSSMGGGGQTVLHIRTNILTMEGDGDMFYYYFESWGKISQVGTS